MKNILERIGFTGEESAVYTALLELGPSSITEIIKKAKLHRPKAYKVVSSLMDKDLVRIMPKGKSKLYVAESPEKIERLFSHLETEFNKEIQSLYESYEAQSKKPRVTYYEGDKSIIEAYADVVHTLKKNDTYYRYSSALTLQRKKYLPRDYREIRDKKQLERLVITNADGFNLRKAKLGKTVKAVPKDFDLFSHNVSQIIYGNKVSFIDYNSKSTITIENPMIAEFQKKIFKLLFKRL